MGNQKQPRASETQTIYMDVEKIVPLDPFHNINPNDIIIMTSDSLDSGDCDSIPPPVSDILLDIRNQL